MNIGKTYEHDPLTESIIGCRIDVHKALGPGLFESVYEEAVCIELGEHRPDLIVSSHVVVEIKSVQRLDRVHDAQTLTYMRLTGMKVGLLVNFNEAVLKNGIRRFAL